MAAFFLILYLMINISDEGTFIYILKWMEDLADKNSWINEEVIFSTISIIFLALTVFNWILSYHLFRKSQITDRKLFRR